MTLAAAAALVRAWQDAGERVAATAGAFDLLHEGHLHLLTQARAAADRLVVLVYDDGRVRQERGEVSRHELNRYWAQVVLHPGGCGRQAVLALRSHGRQVEFGRHLTEEQRCRMAGIIRAELGNR